MFEKVREFGRNCTENIVETFDAVTRPVAEQRTLLQQSRDNHIFSSSAIIEQRTGADSAPGDVYTRFGGTAISPVLEVSPVIEGGQLND